jgi:restriction system protein
MPRYWVIAPISAEDPEFERIWKSDLDNGWISIGWTELGDYSVLTEDTLREKIDEVYPVAKRTSRLFNMLWNFCHEARVGDVMIARRGRRTIAGVGAVTGAAFYSQKRDGRHSTYLPVEWRDHPRDLVLPKMAFGMQTIYEIEEGRFGELVGDPSTTSIRSREDGVENEAEFVLEKYLEDFVVTNLPTIFGGELVLYKDPKESVDGQQYATDVGTIDILAQDVKSKGFVVIELKKGREADKVVGQVLRYMGWIQEELAADGQTVKGLIICREPDQKLTYALKMTPGVEIRYYKISFKLLGPDSYK